jgi:protein TonB
MNKRFLIIFSIICLYVLPAVAQDTTYYDASWKLTIAPKALYFRAKTKTDAGWKVNDCYISGKIQMSGTYIDDSCKIQQGDFSFYNEKGHLYHISHYEHGKLEGVDKLYYDDDQIRTEGKFKDGKQEGEWVGYYPSGKPSAHVDFKDGNQISGKFFDENGKRNKSVTEFSRNALFPGGLPSLQRFLIRNLHYPDTATKANIQGTVVVGFLVTKEGNIEDIKVSSSVDPALDEEALRVIRLMPEWDPLIVGGILCDATRKQPIVFRLQSD